MKPTDSVEILDDLGHLSRKDPASLDGLLEMLYTASSHRDRSRIGPALDRLLAYVDHWSAFSPGSVATLFERLDPSRLVRAVGQTLLASTLLDRSVARQNFLVRFLEDLRRRGTPEAVVARFQLLAEREDLVGAKRDAAGLGQHEVPGLPLVANEDTTPEPSDLTPEQLQARTDKTLHDAYDRRFMPSEPTPARRAPSDAYDRRFMPSEPSDLTPEQLQGMWDRDVILADQHRAVGAMLVRMAVREIRRRRGYPTFSKQRVHEVVERAVREHFEYTPADWVAAGGSAAKAIADCVVGELVSAHPNAVGITIDTDQGGGSSRRNSR